jgi:hypothetical protein
MNKVKLFISYSTLDIDKKEIIKNLINNSEKLEAIVVLEQYSSLDYNAEKIKKSLDSCMVFLPILTSNSINNQWVNQEIGYVFGSNIIKIENIFPIVEKNIMSDLKGFISDSNDLNFRYEGVDEFNIQAENLVKQIIEKYINFGEYHTY